MPRVTYVSAGGVRTTAVVPVGDTVLDGALDNGIPGLIGQCGGGCTCSTCHCYVAPPWQAKLPAAEVDEAALLEYAIDWRPTSRLACQIRITAALDGLVVGLPERQLP